ncbi:MAG: NYN domain-containing protein [bacterium]|nr:NYN domain-containing protein [bacterium]
MVIKHPGQRVAVLIDVQNLYYSARNLYGARVNFGAILKLAVADRVLIRAFAYVVRTKTGEEKPFFEALIKLGIETRVRDLQEFFGGAKKADWDVGITVDAIRIAQSCDTIVLCSGDGDFLQLLEYLKNQGKRTEVVAFGRSSSSKLKEITDEFIDLELDTDKSLLKSYAKTKNLKNKETKNE